MALTIINLPNGSNIKKDPQSGYTQWLGSPGFPHVHFYGIGASNGGTRIDNIFFISQDNLEIHDLNSLITTSGANVSFSERMVALLQQSGDDYVIGFCPDGYEFLVGSDWLKIGEKFPKTESMSELRQVETVSEVKIITLFTKLFPQQKVIFGPPGTGKSYSVGKIKEELHVNDADKVGGTIRTIFHPEYSYGDFVAKLLPITKITDDGGQKSFVEYQIHSGPFIQTLAKALAYPTRHFLLVIDEINRGNCASIFGDIFQLLDRKDSGESEYPIDPSELTRLALINELKKCQAIDKVPKQICIPRNMSIVATMNTSDESVFYMDSAFKRRWQFQYIGPDDHEKDSSCPQQNAKVEYKGASIQWDILRGKINTFLLKNSKSVRRIEDKQIGLWFIKAKDKKIAREDIQFKLMHYLWDNVFARDKEPLCKLLGLLKDEDANDLVTFGQFVNKCDDFLEKIITVSSEAKETQDETTSAMTTQ